MSDLRLRFAPSPTGYLHVGGARTALVNWLFARSRGGVLILRIEDTDVERSTPEMTEAILDALRWLRIDWDEGPYFQSERGAMYRAAAQELLAKGAAYRCYCRPEDLEAKREAARAKGVPYVYDRACLRLTDAERAAKDAAGAPWAARFRVPEGETIIDDLVMGEVRFQHANIEDFVLLRNDGHPTYHLSVVVDDVDIRITHVIRGADHISNTPKQILLYGALGKPVPRFGHLPLILGPDKTRLSKRHGATSVESYRDAGILPETMVNFLALLGWSPGEGQEVLARDTLVARFDLAALSKANAVFDPKKLEWLNSQHISGMPAEALAERVGPVLREAGLWRDAFGAAGRERAWFLRVLDLLKARSRRIGDFATDGRPFFSDEFAYDPDAVAKRLGEAGLVDRMRRVRERFAETGGRGAPGAWTAAALEEAVRALADAEGAKAAAFIHPVRVAVTGAAVGPSLFEVLEVLGPERVVARLDRLIAFLEERERAAAR
jgi:glutamyl-tRNA synthetase